MMYFLIILISMIIISTIDIIFFCSPYGIEWWYVVIAVIISTAVEIMISGLIAFVVRWLLPSKWFTINKKFYAAGKEESKFYEKLGIKKWKDKVLELGSFTNFHKDKVQEPTNNAYIERFITEANYGVVIHSLSIPLGFLVIFIYPIKFWFLFGLPVALVGAFLNILPTFILRYNLPKLYSLHKFNSLREQRTKNIQ